jgi:superfamily I DNA and/or RNA helicase
MRAILQKWASMMQIPTEEVGYVDARGLVIAKMGDTTDGEGWPEGLRAIDPYNDRSSLNPLLQRPYLILGATPGSLYNLGKYRGSERGVDWTQQPFDLLVVDEASQMGAPEAMLAGAFLKPGGSLLVVGDHRQMPPIVAHNWEQEERRSVQITRPYRSLFEFLIDQGFHRIALDQSFRLNHRLAAFLRDNIYRHDGIEFFSVRKDALPGFTSDDAYVAAVMDPGYPIIFVEHDEAAAQQYNELELALVIPLIAACQEALQLEGTEGIGVVVPHRAQRALLQQQFPTLAAGEAIDTVERFQGGERDVIIVSATASDPDFVLAEADFLLDSNRLNVAISRPRKKLVVVASRTITGLLVSDLETFERAAVWKRLFHQCAHEALWQGSVGGHQVRVRGCAA